MIGRFGQINHLVPISGALDHTTNTFNTTFVDMTKAHRATLGVIFGAITASSTTLPKLTLLSATSSATTGAEAIAFKYRISAAVATDTQGAITDATSAGIDITASYDNMLLMIDVDPALVAGKTDGRWVYLHVTSAATISALATAVFAELEPRYIAASPTSAS